MSRVASGLLPDAYEIPVWRMEQTEIAETQIGKQKRCFGIIEALELARLKTEPLQGCLVNEK